MIGTTVKGKYRIYDTVGTGGFATVYLGRNTETNEIVAVKVLSAQYTRDEQYLERFRREASMAERLHHPNIVRVLDHGVQDGRHYLVMEFVEGLTLEHLLARRGPLSIEETASFAEQVCAGLEAAYRAGIVHRDIKPSNLMITPGGTVKIMDFGIAKVQALGGLTQSGMFMGTPRYLSPETARGEKVDVRSDLYSAGLLMYEMLTGSPPFNGENPWAILRQHVEADPSPVNEVRPGVPRWLEAIMMRALAKDPARRFQTPADMLAALQAQSVLGPDPSAQPRPPAGIEPTLQIDTPLMPTRPAPSTATPPPGRAVRQPTPGPVSRQQTPAHVPAARQPTPAPRVLERDAMPPAQPTRPRSRVLLYTLIAVVVVAAVAAGALYAFGFFGGPGLFGPAETAVVVVADDGQPAPQPTVPEVTFVVTSPPQDTATARVVVLPTDTPVPEPPTATQAVPPTAKPTQTRAPTETPTALDTATTALTPTAPPTQQPTQPPTQPPTSAPTAAPTQTPKPTAIPAPSVEGRIVFSAAGSLYIVRAADGDILAGPVPNMRQPDFRSDGQLIIANGEGGNTDSLWTLYPTGGLDAEQTSHPDDFHPYFNPGNPGRFVFDSTRLPSGSHSLFIGDLGAKAADDGRQAINHGGGPVIGSHPVWLASDMVVYTGCDYGYSSGANCGLYTVPSWGGVPSRILAGGLTEFASDGFGAQVLFTTQRDGNWEVYLINGDGSGLRNISNSAGSQDGLGTFAPDGKMVAFVSDRGGTWAVWAVKIDGTGAARLFNLPAPLTGTWTDERISWAP